ncbi:ABC transporter ATP-binding protein [Pumilibacter intestinalis]|uniref:ABC transporter ATP-binding protein n=1 Tax=Pumilibacter intestinalis TaxID=2941511 RepID=UPI00203F714E|nr:ABC transporter ATP-binding protein [Pumilibacter intestinalis]
MPPMRGNDAPVQKAKHTRKSLIQLLKYSKRCLPAIIIALTIAVASAVFSIVGPKYVGKLGDYIAAAVPKLDEATGNIILPGPMDYKAIVDIAVFLVTIYSVGAVLSYVQGYIMNSVTQRVCKSLRNDISRKINRLPLRYFDNTLFGDVLSRVTNDVDAIAQSLNQSVISLVTSFTMLIGVLVMMFTINWIMALTVIGATIVGFGFMMLIMSKSQKYFLAQQRNLGAINGHVEEIYSGHNVVKVLGGEKQAKRTFNEINGKLYASGWKSQFLSGLMMPLMNFVGNFGFVAVCVVGGVLAIQNGAGFIGTIISFMIYVRLFTNPLSQIAQGMNSMQSAAAASERVFEFLNEEELSPDAPVTELKEIRGEVEFKNVRFGYDPERTIINDFSAHVYPGQKVAIVGPTGAGKTTMVNLLMRFYEVNGGSITIDGVDIKDLTRENIHDLFGMVLQDTWLFEGTVRDNIVYSKTDAPDEKVIKAAKAAGLDHFIRTLPHGYNTVLDDKTSISAGQKQLITIARAMVEDAPMLILDEATSSVDTRTEVLIQEAMDTLTKGRTSFVIAHRLSTIKNADLILVMKDGDVIESGNHNELMEKGGFYSDLYNSQFAAE